MARVQFTETVVIPGGPGGTLIPVAGVAATPYNINSDGTEGSQATTYIDRTSMTNPPNLATDETGTVSFWMDSGDYDVHIDDQQNPPRIKSYIRGFTAPVIDTNQLVVAAQNLIQFTGDTKFSLQTADHGLKSDGTYEWLIVVSNADGGGRKVDHVLYPGLYQLLGSPAPDGLGMFRLPNVSGRALIATGSATGRVPRSLLDLVGEETHLLIATELASHPHGLNDPGHVHSISAVNIPQAPSSASWQGSQSQDGTGSVSPRVPAGTAVTNFTTVPNHTTGITVQNNVGDTAHNNMQPSAGMNLFVKS